MRVAYLNSDPGVPVFGTKGCSVHVQEVIRALLTRGAEVEVFAARAGGPPPPDLARIRVQELPALPKVGLAVRERAALAANAELREALARRVSRRSCPSEGLDTNEELSAASSLPPPDGMAEKPGPQSSEPAFDFFYERYSLWSHAGLEYARALGLPAILEVNAPLIEEQSQHRGLMDRPAAEAVAQRVFAAATAVVAVSDEVAAYLDRWPEARGKVSVIPNAVNPARFPASQQPTLPKAPGTFTIGFVGSLKPWHGLSTLAEAFSRLHRRHPEARLLVVGDGASREGFQADLASRGAAAAAHFTGAVAPAGVPGLLASMDAAVAPYPALANFYFSPLKVYEYLAAGLPVVASRLGQLERLVEHGVTGLLVPPENAAALADALERLQGDGALRARLGQAARARVLRDHTWDAVVRRILRLAGLDAAARP